MVHALTFLFISKLFPIVVLIFTKKQRGLVIFLRFQCPVFNFCEIKVFNMGLKSAEAYSEPYQASMMRLFAKIAAVSRQLFLQKVPSYMFDTVHIRLCRPAKSHEFAVRLLVLTGISRSHAKAQNSHSILTTQIVFFLCTRWRIFSCF